ncbi:MAG: ATP-binding protein [Bacteroidota bacterium]
MFYRKILGKLTDWKNSTTRKPLIIRGARQVGKTTLVHEFSKSYDQYLYVNLEKNEYRELFEQYTDIKLIAEQLFFLQDKQWTLLKNTLLFIDEIQEVPTAVNFLRYFKEELPELHVIAAGSMLETLLGKNVSFPVGRVDYLVLRPVSFEEFLGALGELSSLEQFNKVPLSDFAYGKLLKLFHTYAIIGGMPEIVQHYVQYRDLTALKNTYNSLLNSYLEDAEKYARSTSQLQIIRFILNQSLHEAGKRVTFQNFGNSNYKSKEIAEVLRALQKTHLLTLTYPCIGYSIPLQEDFKKAPRLHFLDSGLINFKVGLQKEILGTKDLCSVYQGTLIEHLVGQELLSNQNLPLDALHFWVREKNTSSAELDYVYPYESKLVPVEVKSGPRGRIKSLAIFMEKSELNFAIRFYAGERSLDTLKTPEGKTFYLLSLPYFLASKTEAYIEWLLNNLPEQEGSNTLSDVSLQYKRTKKTEKAAASFAELEEKHYKVLNFCKDDPQKSQEIIEDGLQLSFQTRNKRLFLKPLLDLGLLEWTDKENPKSKKQAYKLTEKGKKALIASPFS